MSNWIEAQSPSPPPRLAERLSAALPPAARSAVRPTPDVLIEAAVAILRQTSAEPSDERNRAAALDLLAADALITYAVEAAADDCDSFVAQTDDMLKRISSGVIEPAEPK